MSERDRYLVYSDGEVVRSPEQDTEWEAVDLNADVDEVQWPESYTCYIRSAPELVNWRGRIRMLQDNYLFFREAGHGRLLSALLSVIHAKNCVTLFDPTRMPYG